VRDKERHERAGYTKGKRHQDRKRIDETIELRRQNHIRDNNAEQEDPHKALQRFSKCLRTSRERNMILRRKDALADILGSLQSFLLRLPGLDIGIDRDRSFTVTAPYLGHGLLLLHHDQIGKRHQLTPVITHKKTVDLGARIYFAFFKLHTDIITTPALFISPNLNSADHGLNDLGNARNAHPVGRSLISIRHHMKFGLTNGIIRVRICNKACFCQLVHHLL